MSKITYTKDDITRKLSYQINMNQSDSKIIFDCVLDIFKDLLIDNSNETRIELRNFGVFDVINTKERKNARNPKTKELVVIPKRKKIVFKASKTVKMKLYEGI